MKEKDLKELGFKKVKVSAEEAGEAVGYYYYVYNLEKYNVVFDLISSTNDESQDGWYVSIFGLRFKPLTKLQVKRYIKLINELK